VVATATLPKGIFPFDTHLSCFRKKKRGAGEGNLPRHSNNRQQESISKGKESTASGKKKGEQEQLLAVEWRGYRQRQ